MALNGRQLMTGSSPHLAVLGYHRTVSAPAGGAQPTLVGVDPGQAPAGPTPSHLQPSPAGFDARPHTISSTYERCYHARSSLSPATFEPPPSMIHRAPAGQPAGPPAGAPAGPPAGQLAGQLAGPPPPPMHVHRLPPPVAGRGQRHHRDEVIYQSVLRTPGSPLQLQQQTANNDTCDITPGIYLPHIIIAIIFILQASVYIFGPHSRYKFCYCNALYCYRATLC